MPKPHPHHTIATKSHVRDHVRDELARHTKKFDAKHDKLAEADGSLKAQHEITKGDAEQLWLIIREILWLLQKLFGWKPDLSPKFPPKKVSKDPPAGPNVKRRWLLPTCIILAIIFILLAALIVHNVGNNQSSSETAVTDQGSNALSNTTTSVVVVPTPTFGSGNVTVALNSGGVGTSGKWTTLTANGTAEWTFTVADKDKQFVFVRDCADLDYTHVQPAVADPKRTGKSMCLQNRNSNYDIVVGYSWTLV